MTEPDSDTVRRLAAYSSCEIKVKNSRFVAHAFNAATRDEVARHLEKVHGLDNDASHYCYAYRIGPSGDDFRFDDDGEPTGTAGPPILRQIDSFDLLDTLVVVSRYYGGTKLGAGGLIRAYGGAAREALNRASIIETIRRQSLEITFPYESTSAVAAVISKYDAKEKAADYTEQSKLILAVPTKDVGDFTRDFTDAVRGQGTIQHSNS